MKKKLVSTLLCVAMVSTMLAGCGGSVYYLNFKPEVDAQWQRALTKSTVSIS